MSARVSPRAASRGLDPGTDRVERLRRAARAHARRSRACRGARSASARRAAASSPIRRRSSSTSWRSSSACRYAASAASSSASLRLELGDHRPRQACSTRSISAPPRPTAAVRGRLPTRAACRAAASPSTAVAVASVRRARDRTWWRGTPARRRRARGSRRRGRRPPRAPARRARRAARGHATPLAEPWSQPPLRRSCSRSSARRRAAASLRESRSASAVSGLVLLGHLGLLLQRLELPAELGEHVRQAEQVLIETGELALRPLLAAAVLRDPGGLLDVLAPLLGPRQQHLFELSLPHDGVERAADPRSPTEAPGRPSAERPGRRCGTRTRRCGRSCG